MGKVFRAPGDFPSGKQGDVLTVAFTETTPVVLARAIADPAPAAAQRAFDAMMGMTKIDVAAIEAALRG